MRIWIFILGVVCSLQTDTARAAANPPAPLTHEDLWLMKQPGPPSPSPDGRWIVFPVTEPSYDEKEERANLWIVPSDGSQPARRLTNAKARESSPAWSPDSAKIAFTAKREGDDATQIYLINLSGGEAHRRTQAVLGARRPLWSPDGRSILYQSTSYLHSKDEVETKKISEERKKSKSKVRTYDGFPIRRWDKWIDDTQTRLFVISAEGSAPARDLIAGTKFASLAGFRGVGDEGSGDNLQPVWHNDGQSVIFAATTNFTSAAFQQPVYELFEQRIDGGEPRKLTRGQFNASNPQFTADGSKLLFTASADVDKTYYAVNQLMSVDWPWRGEPARLMARFDRSIDSFAVAREGGAVHFTAEDSGRIGLWTASMDGADIKRRFDDWNGVWLAPKVAERVGDPVLFANWGAAHRPAELYKLNLTSGERTRLTSFNVEKAEALDWTPLREFWHTNKSGHPIHSYLALPPGFRESGSYPLLVLIHGGHANMWRDAITLRWNYHLLAKPGFVVLLTDYIGSTGYGEAFTRAIQGNPLRGPAEDLNTAADEAIRRFSFIDRTRQAAAGASYGGHLANWLEATTSRYRCLISHAGLASLYAQWSTSDAIYHRELMMGGPFWENPKAWLDQSPATYASAFKTPMLLSIGESDFRVPLNNVLEMWSLLQRQRIPGRLLVWPDENHWILKGENSKVFYNEVDSWLSRWLKGKE